MGNGRGGVDIRAVESLLNDYAFVVIRAGAEIPSGKPLPAEESKIAYMNSIFEFDGGSAGSAPSGARSVEWVIVEPGPEK